MKRIVSIILVVLGFVFWITYSLGPKYATFGNMFNKEGVYYVYFYRDGCEESKKTRQIIMDYHKLVRTKEYDEYNQVYRINISRRINYPLFHNRKSYFVDQPDENWLFPYRKIDEVEYWSELRIDETPMLIQVYGRESRYGPCAYFEAVGHDDIKKVLEDHLKKT